MIKDIIPKRWQAPLAWGSLFLNILLIAVIVIGPQRILPYPPHKPPTPQRIMSRVARDLNKEDKAIFDTILAKYIPAFNESRVQIDKALTDISDAASKDALNMDAVKDANDRLITVRTHTDRMIASFVYEMLHAISDEGRKQLKLRPPKRSKPS